MKAYWDNGPVQLYQADARAIPLADQTVHCVVTSPPYYGLRVYADNDDRGIGAETSVEDYIDNMVDVFRDVWRVLRDDGVVWLNIGDSYGENGNRLGIPEQLVLALQSDGWTWRDTIIWHKKSAMPESVVGWRWERCKVKITATEPRTQTQKWGVIGRDGSGTGDPRMGDHSGETRFDAAQFQDCPDCPKCADNDGLVLRRGSWRTTSAHEYIYMLTKGMGYYADGEAVKTAGVHPAGLTRHSLTQPRAQANGKSPSGNEAHGFWTETGNANRRSVWNDISPEPYGGAHFATFPSDLPRLCIQASTSERGCCSECGSQWARVVETNNPRLSDEYQTSNHSPKMANPLEGRNDFGGKTGLAKPGWREHGDRTSTTLGWRPTCNHNAPAIPATVLDPFSGTATTCRAAQKLGRRAVGVDISESYLEQAVRRLSAVTLPMDI